MIIHAIRHLRTSWNDQGLMQGRTDIDLLDNDDQNSKITALLKEQLTSISPELIVCSPLKRAVQTAEALDLEFVEEPLISEMSFGQFEGQPKEEILQSQDVRWYENPSEGILKSEFDRLENRIRLFLEKYQQHEEILIVSHGAYIRGLKAIVENDSLNGMNKVMVDNGVLITLETE